MLLLLTGAVVLVTIADRDEDVDEERMERMRQDGKENQPCGREDLHQEAKTRNSRPSNGEKTVIGDGSGQSRMNQERKKMPQSYMQIGGVALSRAIPVTALSGSLSAARDPRQASEVLQRHRMFYASAPTRRGQLGVGILQAMGMDALATASLQPVEPTQGVVRAMLDAFAARLFLAPASNELSVGQKRRRGRRVACVRASAWRIVRRLVHRSHVDLLRKRYLQGTRVVFEAALRDNARQMAHEAPERVRHAGPLFSFLFRHCLTAGCMSAGSRGAAHHPSPYLGRTCEG